MNIHFFEEALFHNPGAWSPPWWKGWYYTITRLGTIVLLSNRHRGHLSMNYQMANGSPGNWNTRITSATRGIF